MMNAIAGVLEVRVYGERRDAASRRSVDAGAPKGERLQGSAKGSRRIGELLQGYWRIR